MFVVSADRVPPAMVAGSILASCGSGLEVSLSKALKLPLKLRRRTPLFLRMWVLQPPEGGRLNAGLGDDWVP